MIEYLNYDAPATKLFSEIYDVHGSSGGCGSCKGFIYLITVGFMTARSLRLLWIIGTITSHWGFLYFGNSWRLYYSGGSSSSSFPFQVATTFSMWIWGTEESSMRGVQERFPRGVNGPWGFRRLARSWARRRVFR